MGCTWGSELGDTVGQVRGVLGTQGRGWCILESQSGVALVCGGSLGDHARSCKLKPSEREGYAREELDD